jgi:hypothetical protein
MVELLSTSRREAADLATWVQEGKEMWRARNTRWARVRRYLAMNYMQRSPGHELFLSNEPRVQHDMATSIMSGEAPTFRWPITIQDPGEKEAFSKTERLADGVFREISHRHRKRLHSDFLYELNYYSLLGAICAFPHVDEGADGQVQFKCDLWDPMQVYPTLGDDGLSRIVREYVTSADTAFGMAERNEWDVEKLKAQIGPEKEITIVNAFWMEGDEVWNAVTFGTYWAKDPTRQDLMKHIPVIFLPSKGVPFREYGDGQGTNESWQAMWGQAFIDPNLELYSAFDRAMTYGMEIMRRTAMLPYMDINEGGNVTISEKDILEGRTIGRKIGETVEPIRAPVSPREREQLLDYYQGAMQRGTLSYIVFGAQVGDISGVMGRQLSQATRTLLRPFIQTSEEGLIGIICELLEQYKASDFGPLKLEVRQRQEGLHFQTLVEDFKKTDIPMTDYLRITLPLSLPDDRLQTYAALKQIIPGNEPLMSTERGMDEFLGVQDPALEMDKIAKEGIKREVKMTIGRVAAFMEVRDEYIEKGQDELADFVDQLIEKERLLLQETLGPEKNLPPDERPRQSEPRPEIQPPESSGTPPDALANEFAASGSTGQPVQGQAGGRLRNILRRISRPS